jgi:hypothetical protein
MEAAMSARESDGALQIEVTAEGLMQAVAIISAEITLAEATGYPGVASRLRRALKALGADEMRELER